MHLNTENLSDNLQGPSYANHICSKTQFGKGGLREPPVPHRTFEQSKAYDRKSKPTALLEAVDRENH